MNEPKGDQLLRDGDMDAETRPNFPGLPLEQDQDHGIEAMAMFGPRLYVGVVSGRDDTDERSARIFRLGFGDLVWQEVYHRPLPSSYVEIEGRLRKVALPQGFRHFSVRSKSSDRSAALTVPLIALNGSCVLESGNGNDFREMPNPSPAPGLPPLGEMAAIGDRVFAEPAVPLGMAARCDALNELPPVFVTDDPASGTWTAACEPGFGRPANRFVSCLAGLDGFIYAATVNLEHGFEVWRTDAEGKPPYQWQLVVDEGAYRYTLNKAVASMTAADDTLLLGTAALAPGILQVGNHGPEIIRIASDGRWDIVMGTPRFSPAGLKMPLSASGPGFGHPENAAITRLISEGGRHVALIHRFRPARDKGSGIGDYAGGVGLWLSEDAIHWREDSDDQLGGFQSIDSACFTPLGLVVGGTWKKGRARVNRAAPLVLLEIAS
jgi:hypothetical protein